MNTNRESRRSGIGIAGEEQIANASPAKALAHLILRHLGPWSEDESREAHELRMRATDLAGSR